MEKLNSDCSTNLCALCLKNKVLTKEHVVPYMLGGRFYSRMLCQKCNNEILGSNIEEIFADNILVRLARLQNGLSGRHGHKLKSIFDRSSGYIGDDKIPVNGDYNGQPRISNVEVNFDEDDNAIVKASFNAETSAEERCNEILKAAERSWMEHHPNGTDSELADFKKRMAKSVETTSGEVVSSDKVTIHETFDFGNVVLFFMRTAYELACYTHGSEYYLNSPTAAELRRAIMNKDPGAKIHGQVMPSDAEARCLFSIIDKDKYNYAILMGGFAFISILGITGIIQYDDKGGRFSIPVECAPLLLFEVAKDSNLRRPAMITTFVDYITRNSVDRDMALRNLDLGLFGDQQQ